MALLLCGQKRGQYKARFEFVGETQKTIPVANKGPFEILRLLSFKKLCISFDIERPFVL
jgi:hypothetical protein